MSGVLGGLIASYGFNKPTSVTGGTLVSDATYFYRVFSSNGTFSVTGGTLKCDIISFGGGGGPGGGVTGASASGGGSGSGGYISILNQTFAGTSWPIVIGGGGAGSNGANGSNGTNTTINNTTVVALGGGGGAYGSNTATPNNGNNGGGGGGGSSSSVTGVNGAFGTGNPGSTSEINGTVTRVVGQGGNGYGNATANLRASGGGGGTATNGTAPVISTLPVFSLRGGAGGQGVFLSSWLTPAVSAIPSWSQTKASVTTSTISQSLTVDSTLNLFTGMLVTHPGVGANVYITRINSGVSVSISATPIASTTASATFTLYYIAAGGAGTVNQIDTSRSVGIPGRGGVNRENVSSLVNSGAGATGVRDSTSSTVNGGSGVVIIRYLRTAV